MQPYGLYSLYLLIPNFQSFHSLYPPSLATTGLFSMSSSLWIVRLCHILDSTYKWYCIFDFVCQTYFTYCDNLQVHPCCCKWHYYVLFHGWVVFYCIHVPHHLYPFICHWTFRLFPCLGCCVNSTSVNIGVHVSFWIILLFGYMPTLVLLDCGNSVFIFWGTSVLFSIVAASTYILPNSLGGFHFLHTLSRIYFI